MVDRIVEHLVGTTTEFTVEMSRQLEKGVVTFHFSPAEERSDSVREGLVLASKEYKTTPKAGWPYVIELGRAAIALDLEFQVAE